MTFSQKEHKIISMLILITFFEFCFTYWLIIGLQCSNVNKLENKFHQLKNKKNKEKNPIKHRNKSYEANVNILIY